MRTLGLFVALLAAPLASLAAPPITLTTATLLTPAEDADVQSVAAASDGTLYVVGNAAARGKSLPGSLAARHLGPEMKSPRCGSAFVARLSADGRKLLAFADLPPGAMIGTTVQVNAAGVYVGGYASHGLEPLLQNVPGMTRSYPLASIQATSTQPGAKPDRLDRGPGLGRFGAPAVLRFDADLAKVTAGTYLEGWQQVWEKYRTSSSVKPMPGYREYFWQPTSIGLLKSGDVVVSHDGGYGRDITDADRQHAGGDAKFAGKFGFYDVPDHVSRLTADLARRTWKRDIYTPEVAPENVREVWPKWPLGHYGNPRTHRLRLASDESVYICGWSASATKAEPWWSPYVWKLDPADGRVATKFYNQDPIGGTDHRMNGNVADTACVTVALDDQGNLLTSLIADGGNSPVIGRSPKADGSKFEGKIKDRVGVKLVHFWGQISRVDATTREGLAGTMTGPWAWVTDMAPLPAKQVLAVGRYNDKFTLTPDAWNSETLANPNAFLRVYGEDFTLVFSTSLPGVVPFELTRVSPTRFVLAGRADKPAAPLAHSLAEKALGRSAGYLMVVDVQP